MERAGGICGVALMLESVVEMSIAGVGDYWNDVAPLVMCSTVVLNLSYGSKNQCFGDF